MAAKRIILMYISEISGHHSATLAIEKALIHLRPDTQVLNINAFNYTNPISEKIINRLYMSVIKRTPKLWDYLYDNPTVVKNIENIKQSVHRFNSPKLKNLFDQFKPDAILCTQAFPCGMVADYKKTYGSSIPLVAVLTDYIPHSYWIYDEVSFFITPSEDVSERLIKKGVPSRKIKAFGIPFDQKFNDPLDKTKIYKKLRLSPEIPTILIMGGGQGLGPIKTIIKSLEKLDMELQEIIVCGTNKRLFKSLKRRLKKFKKKVLVFGYSNHVHELMKISKFIISKPGGVTTAEMLANKLAMVIVKPIPGQEANNALYLTEKQAAIRIDTPKEINHVVEELLVNPAKLQKFCEGASRISKPNASTDIAKLLFELTNV